MPHGPPSPRDHDDRSLREPHAAWPRGAKALPACRSRTAKTRLAGGHTKTGGGLWPPPVKTALEITAILHRDVAVTGEDEMVDKLDVQELRGACETPRVRHIFVR